MRIGFTVGVFDLLHHGHSNLLEEAAKHCDLLIVGVTTDRLARLQKGHDRPAWSQQKRWNEVRKTGVAHKVVLIDSENVLPYLEVTDVWILGEDQLNMTPSPCEYRGEMVFIPQTPGISTTILLEKAARNLVK